MKFNIASKVVVIVLLTVYAVPSARALVLDFDDTLHATNGFESVDVTHGESNPYTYISDGFILRVADTGGELGNWGSAHSSFLADPVIASGSSGSYLELTHSDGNLFEVTSIDVIDFLSGQAAANVGNDVTFYGVKADNSVVDTTFTFGTTAFDKETFALTAEFSGLTSFSWNQNSANEPFSGAVANRVHMVDNLIVNDQGPAPPDPPGPTTIVAFGDSTTNARNVGAALNGRPIGPSTSGINSTDGSNLPHNIVNSVDESSNQLYVYSDQLRDRLASVSFPLEAIDNEGIGSNRTDQAVSRLNSDVLAKSPEIVIVQYGINDSAHDGGVGTDSRVALDFTEQTGGDGILGNGNDHQFASRGNYTDNLTSLVQDMQNEDIEVILMTPNKVVDYNVVTNARLSLYAQVVRDVALAEGAELFDVWQSYQDYEDDGNSIGDFLLDGVHPNGDGHQLVSDGLFELIIGSLGSPNGVVGDVNQDGIVFGDGFGLAEIDDVTAFRDGWLTTGHIGVLEMYTHGDMNFDGITSLADAFILHKALVEAGSVISLGELVGSGQEAPEPTGWLMVVIGFVCLARHGQRAVAVSC